MFRKKTDVISDAIVNDQIASARKIIIRDATRKVKEGTLKGEGIALYLPSIDSHIRPIKSEVERAFIGQETVLRGIYSDKCGDVDRRLMTFNGMLRELYTAQKAYEEAAQNAGMDIEDTAIEQVDYSDLKKRYMAIRRKVDGKDEN